MSAERVAARLTGLCVSFAGHPAVEEVSLELPATGISVFIGRSGSGKTTLLRALNRLNEEFPGCVTSGGVELDLGDGLEPVYPLAGRATCPLPTLRRRVGMVFQTPNVFPASLRRNIALPLALVAECPKREVDGRMRAALENVGLWDEVKDRLDMPAERLSGGQQQRLCLARALALEPAMLLLDEPTASLDVRATAEVEALLRRLADRYPVIMVSHSLAQTRRLGQNVFVLDKGRVTRRLRADDGLDERELNALLGGPEQAA